MWLCDWYLVTTSLILGSSSNLFNVRNYCTFLTPFPTIWQFVICFFKSNFLLFTKRARTPVLTFSRLKREHGLIYSNVLRIVQYFWEIFKWKLLFSLYLTIPLEKILGYHLVWRVKYDFTKPYVHSGCRLVNICLLRFPFPVGMISCYNPVYTYT